MTSFKQLYKYMERALAQIPNQEGGRAMVFNEEDRDRLVQRKSREQGYAMIKKEINQERARQEKAGEPVHLSDELFRRLQSWKASLPYTVERSNLERRKKAAKEKETATARAYKRSKGKREKDFFANLESLSPSDLKNMSGVMTRSRTAKAGKRR